MTSAVYSPDGQTLYMTTAEDIYSVSSDGDSVNWHVDVDDSDFCDIAVSPDGWSVRIWPQEALTVYTVICLYRYSAKPLFGYTVIWLKCYLAIPLFG